jgi:hypothetical protein
VISTSPVPFHNGKIAKDAVLFIKKANNSKNFYRQSPPADPRRRMVITAVAGTMRKTVP